MKSRGWCPLSNGFVGLFLFIVMVLVAGCEKDKQQAGSVLLPLSDELKPALDASRQSLAGSDQGVEKYKQDLDRYFGIEQMLRDPQLRAGAADSLFILWEANPTNFLWPDLAAWKWNLLDRGLEPGATFFHPALSDSTNAVGAYARAFRTIGYSSRGEDFYTAWELRDTLDPFQRIWLQLKLAWLERRGGRDKEAIRLAMSALPEARRLGGRRLEQFFWTEITRGLIQGDHLDDAMHAVTMAEELALSVAGENGMIYQAQSLRQLRADVLAARQETEAALALYEDCAEAALEVGIPYLATLNLNRAGMLTSRTGDYELGLRLNQRSLAISLADRDSLNVPRLLLNIARRHRLLGRLDSCLVYQQQAERWATVYPDLALRARLPLIQAEYYAQIGDYGTVDSLLNAAAALVPNHDNMQVLAELHLRMIEESMERGRPDLSYRSIAMLDSLRDRLGSSLADRNEVVDLDLHIADFLGRQGQFKLSVEAMDRAESALDAKDDRVRRWRLAKLRGELARRRGDHLAAESAFRQCITLSEEKQNRDLLATSRFLLSSLLLEQNRFEEARRLFPESSDEAFGGRFRTRLSILLLRGISYSRAGNPEAALLELGRARQLCTPASPPDIVARIGLETGRAHAAAGRSADARKEYSDVQANLKLLDDELTAEALVFLSGDLRRELLESLLETIDWGKEEIVGESRARQALAQAVAILPAWDPPRPDVSTGFTSPQLVYFVGKESSYRWFLGETGAELIRLPGETELVDGLSAVLSDLLLPGRGIPTRALDQLSALLGGAPEGWPGGATLTLVPDGLLYAVPWAVLPWGEGHWLDRGPIELRDAPARGGLGNSPDRRDGRLLVLGVDGSARGRSADLPDLHHAEKEAREVAALWPEGQVTMLVGEDANWNLLEEQALATYEAIHVASHALVFQGSADETTLMLAGSAGSPLTSGEIRDFNLEAELVFLSCCEGAEDFGQGMGPAHAGLARSFLSAGARVVVAPSNRIDDESARHLAGRFYANWNSGSSVAAALRRAQLDLRDGGERWTHPFYWAFYQAVRAP